MGEKLSLKELIVLNNFEMLREHIGETVRVDYYFYGRYVVEYSTLKNVTDYESIELDCMRTPFIGYGTAIKKISIGEKVLYEAHGLPEPYDVRDREQMVEVMERVFGPHQAQKNRQELQELKKKAEEAKALEQEEIKKYQTEELPKLLLETKPYILESKYEEWEKFCINNSENSYSIAVVRMTIEAIIAIGEGMPYEEAVNTICEKKYGVSGYAFSWFEKLFFTYSKQSQKVKKY